MTDFNEAAADWDERPGHAARSRAIADGIRAAIPLDSQMRVLEYGAGTGQLGRELAPAVGHMTLADAAPGMVEVAARRISELGADQRMEARRLDLLVDPLPAERYHLIVAAMMLHHIPDVPVLLRAFRELLRPGGWVALADLYIEDGSFHGAGFTGHNGIEPAELITDLQALGFGDVRLTIPFIMSKEVDGELREYPVFLATSRATPTRATPTRATLSPASEDAGRG